MAYLKNAVFAVVAVAALSVAHASPVGGYGGSVILDSGAQSYGGAQSYSSVSSIPSQSVVLSSAPSVSYASPVVQSYAAPVVQSVQSYAAPVVQSYAAPAVAYTKVVEPEIIAYPRYAFKYGVEDGKTGDVKDQVEERDGDQVKGEYSLLQPDGRKRVVSYVSDKKNGFNAVVSYSGKAIHPEVVQLQKVQLQQVQVPVKVASYGSSYGSEY